MRGSVSRRLFLASTLSSPLLTGACGQSEVRIPNAKSVEIDPQKPLALRPDEGVITGVAMYVEKDAPPLPASLSRSISKSLVFTSASNERFAIPLSPVSNQAEKITESGADIWLRPFSLVVPGGHATTQGLVFMGQMNSFSIYSVRTGASYTSGTPTLMIEKHDPVSFDVNPGEVTYIGRVGIFYHHVRFPDRESRDNACPPGRRAGGAFGGAVPNACGFSEFIIGSDPASDMARIQARFPTLAGHRFRSAPARSTTGNARIWPAVLSTPIPPDVSDVFQIYS